MAPQSHVYLFGMAGELPAMGREKVVIARRNDEAILTRLIIAIVVRLLRRLKKPSRNDGKLIFT